MFPWECVASTHPWFTKGLQFLHTRTFNKFIPIYFMKKSLTQVLILVSISLLIVVPLTIFITKHKPITTKNINDTNKNEINQNNNNKNENYTTLSFDIDNQSFEVIYNAQSKINGKPTFNDFNRIKSSDSGIIVYKNNQSESGSTWQYFVYAKDKTTLFKYFSHENNILDSSRDKDTNYVYKNDSTVMYYPIRETVPVHNYRAIPYHTLAHNPEYKYSLDETYSEDIFCVIDLEQIGLHGYLVYYGVDNFESTNYCQMLNKANIFQIIKNN